MASPPEQSSPKAARILAAAGELLGSRGARGVSVADVAQRAQVGKGTVYLYWDSKEDLVLGLIARDYLAHADEVTAALTVDPGLARPSNLCPHLVRTAAAHPFVQALQRGDAGLLGALADDPRSRTLIDALSAPALLHEVLPIWRRHGLARTDWPLADQAFAVHALILGVVEAVSGSHAPDAGVAPDDVLARTVTAVLGPDRAGEDQVRDTAAECLGVLAAARSTALGFITRSREG